jgi:integrase/recombinase XerD
MFYCYDLMKENMILKGFSLNTQKTYLRQLRAFEVFTAKPLETIAEQEVREYLLYLIKTKNASHSSVGIAYSALKFFFDFVLRQELVMKHIPRSKKPKRLPVILSQDEIQRIFQATDNIKHKAILMTIYGGGLRVSEAANLLLSDIDSRKMQIRIREGKGNVERLTLLSEANLKILRQYWLAYRPNHWLFPGFPTDKPIDRTSIFHIFNNSAAKVGFKHSLPIHSLRHSFATHLLENGVNLLVIQKFLGHAHITTTCRYLHLISPGILQVKSPLDYLDDANV